MFITFEGIEGSGKTSQIQGIRAYLSERGYNVIATREPGSSDHGKPKKPQGFRNLRHTTRKCRLTAKWRD